MSFKRKNTKPIRVFDENQNNEFTDTSMNYDNTTFDDKDATNGLINTHITEPGKNIMSDIHFVYDWYENYMYINYFYLQEGLKHFQCEMLPALNLQSLK